MFPYNSIIEIKITALFINQNYTEALVACYDIYIRLENILNFYKNRKMIFELPNDFKP